MSTKRDAAYELADHLVTTYGFSNEMLRQKVAEALRGRAIQTETNDRDADELRGIDARSRAISKSKPV